MSSGDIRLNKKEVDLFLKEYFAYYTSLSDDWKELFVTRVIYFVQSKIFIGQKGFDLNNKVKVIVSASAIQLTLGLKNWDLRYFSTIILFPSDFYNAHSKLGLKGETDLRGFVSLSWKSFIAGYKIPNDNLNLGLHEFTHALRFNGIRGENTDYFFDNYFPKWYSYAQEAYLDLKKGKPSIFRKYGGANINEFLSVVVEHYFESPKEFLDQQPILYSATAALLNQKANGSNTVLNVRKEELSRLDKPYPFSLLTTKTTFLKSNAASSMFIFLFVAISSGFKTGFFSFPPLFLLMICLSAFAFFDYNFNRVNFQLESLVINKGFFLFRNHKILNISGSRMVKANFYSYDKKQSVVLSFFDKDDRFDEVEIETFFSEQEQRQLIKELEQNFVWVQQKIS